MICLDFSGPLPRSMKGNIHCLLLTDYFSKHVLLFPLRSANAKSFKKIGENVFLDYGSPQYLICDNGGPMRSKNFQKHCNKYGVSICYTAHYFPRAEPTERVNRVVKTMISFYVKESQRRWDENLTAIGCAIPIIRHEATNYISYFVNFGRECIILCEKEFFSQVRNYSVVLDESIKRRQKGLVDISKQFKISQQRSKTVFDLRRRPVEVSPGHSV